MPEIKTDSRSDVLMFYVNGMKVKEPNPDPETTLIIYLRRNLRLTGTKLGCSEGGCGSCTVMVSKFHADSKRVSHFAVNACLAPIVTLHECAVTTVDGIGSTKTKLHEVQKRLAENHGSQCGFCTPGFVMSMYSLLRSKPKPNTSDIDDCLQGNLCRCTGYRPILAAFNTFADQTSRCGKGKGCCMMVNSNSMQVHKVKEMDVQDGLSGMVCKYNDSQELIFPPELMILAQKRAPSHTMKFVGERVTWYRPKDLEAIILLKDQFPDARIVIGNTEVGIETRVKGFHYPVILCPASVREMHVMHEENDGIVIGAACTLSQLGEFLQEICSRKSPESVQTFKCIVDMLEHFAGRQIRNVSCIGGNIMTASPISDINPILVACGATLSFASTNGSREIVMNDDFFTGYRKTSTKKNEILISLKIPNSTQVDVIAFYKQSRRREDDIAIVNSCMAVRFDEKSARIEGVTAVFGGMAAVTTSAKATMQKLVGKSWNQDLLEYAIVLLHREMSLSPDAPGGMVEYRKTLVTSFFFKFYTAVHNRLILKGVLKGSEVAMEPSDPETEKPSPLKATQTFQEVPQDQHPDDIVGRPLMHVSGEKHATGEAVYLDDLAPLYGELQMALVTSSKAHANVLRVDTSAALQSPGVVAYIDHNDIPGEKKPCGEDIFAQDKVTCVGHVIGAILADTHEHAVIASRKVVVEYEDLPHVLTIEDAIEGNSFFGTRRKIRQGHPEKVLRECDHNLEGEMRTGGQEHFYLECQCCLAVPKNEDGEMEIIASSQHPSYLQAMAAECLGVARNKITVRVKRMGGGFGGKETRFRLITNPAVVAARKLGRPVRCVLSRHDDMRITGGRHPLLARYQVGFNSDGRIKAISEDLYINAGNTLDQSAAVLERAMTHFENCYNIENSEVRGHVCFTNLPSNTAFRGFGVPQAMMVAEDWISRVAEKLSISYEKVREVNMYKEGDFTPYGLKLEKFHTPRCWQECLNKSEFDKRSAEVEEFNKIHKWKKRGISCVATKFGIAFRAAFLNQAGALVLIYKDGSVLLSHSGTEMGQGLHTKMVQVTSRELGIPASLIHISETATNAVPNTSSTAGSVSTDLNGMAVKDACTTLNRRLNPIRKSNPGLSWPELVEKAYLNRVGLAATGFFKTPNLGATWNQDTGEFKGRIFNYFTHGAGASEVEVDVLTGDHKIIRTDIVMDIGKSINPSIDIGQVEGAFAQGYGLMTLEELLYSRSGHLWTVGPGAYKLPCASDMPREFNVHLLRSAPHDKAIYSSKAVGEPPLFLAASVFFAIKGAIRSTREERDNYDPFRLDSPATAERIRMACGDQCSFLATNQDASAKAKSSWAIRP